MKGDDKGYKNFAAMRPGSFASSLLVGLLAGLSSMPGVAGVAIGDKPLTVANNNVPGNLALVISAEAPTIVSIGSVGNYTQSKIYNGYFDSAKCYKYVYSETEADRHFYPVSFSTGANCPNTGTDANGRLWSGNFLNWAATQAIDPFRKEMTGGFRIKDTATNTWLEKAINDRNDANSNPPIAISGSAVVVASTPAAAWPSFRKRLHNLGNKMWFTVDSQGTALNAGYPNTDSPMANELSSPVASAGNSPNVVAYNPAYNGLPNAATTTVTNSTSCGADEAGCVKNNNNNNNTSYTHTTYGNDKVYEVSVRVAVCVPGLLESNCKQYGTNYKPEGLIQENSNRLTYSVFSYINNGRSGSPPDGGVMRAPQKFVGPNTRYPESGTQANPRKEWDSTTGVFIQNPDATYLSGSNNAYYDNTNSGAINYINKFGQMATGRLSKYYDNVSELYYSALRYFRGLGNIPGYSNLSANATTQMQEADRFPVIRWNPANDDPIRYQCQVNAILGIGDTNTAQDKSLPGAGTPAGSGESGSSTTIDPSVDVVADLRRIYKIEGRSNSVAEAKADFGASGRSAYIASMAYHANLRDQRADKPGKQRISTFWVDIVEFFDYKNIAGGVGTAGSQGNQYWLAAKYGDVGLSSDSAMGDPDFDPSGAAPTPLLSSWSATGQNVVNPNNGNVVFQRPNNFYTASDAKGMADGLRAAFARLTGEVQGSGGSFASNSTRLEAGAYTYQAKYVSDGWGGQLIASSVDVTTGALTPQWDASTWLAGSPTINEYTKRKMFYNNGGSLNKFFNWAGYTTVLTTPTVVTPTGLSSVTSAQLKYLLGDRSGERQYGGAFRNRRSMLGDIVNSQPVYVGSPNLSLYKDDPSYATFLANQSARTPVVYVGSNDGMLHAFNAGTGTDKGQELFAFMPTASMAVLKQLDTGNEKYPNWDPLYDHAYSMDGEITVADVKDGSVWKTILVASMGRGGKGLYALDVTIPASPTLLWEKSATDITSLGNSLGKPIIAKVASGDWRVFLGNGPNASGGGSTLLALDLMTGTNDGSTAAGSGANNGLGPVNVWDSDKDGNFDTVYAGDMNGDMWKFTIGGSANKLFAAGTNQPITVAPLVSRNPYNPPDTWLFFGTGRYLSLSDITTGANAEVQTWYGLIAAGTISGKSELEQISIVSEDSVGRLISSNGGLDAGKKGWYIDLKVAGGTAKGERMVLPNFFQGLTLIGTSRFPDNNDPCSPSGRGYTMAINPFTGGRLSSSFFDNDGNGTVGNAGDKSGGIGYSGITYDSGPNNPIFIGDIMYTSLDDGSSKTSKTSSSQGFVKRVSWRELLNGS